MTAIINTQQNLVIGKATDGNGRPLRNLKVEIFDVDMRDWESLSETVTDRNGKYQLRWNHKQLRGRGRGEADIAVIVSTQKGTVLFKSSMDEVRFNASSKETINITILLEIPKEVIEFDFLVKEVTFLANKIAIADLQENKKHRDITFLSKELEIPADKIEYLVVAHRLHKLTKIEATFFYALFRTHALLKEGFIWEHTNLYIGIDSDTALILKDIALLEEAKIKSHLSLAVKEKIIASIDQKKLNNYLKIIFNNRKEAEKYYKVEYPRLILEKLNPLFDRKKREELKAIATKNKGNTNLIFEKLNDPSFYKSKTKASNAKREVELIKMFGYQSEIIAKIANARNIKNAEDIKSLAKLNKSNWVSEITKANTDIKDKEWISLYASFLTRKLENDFPTLAFTAQLERESKNRLENQKQIVSFLNTHEDFDLTNHNIDTFFKSKKIALKEREKIEPELKAVQRIFKLVPNYSKTMALREEKIYSSQNIVALGKTQFLNRVAPKAGIEVAEAKKIYQKAENTHLAAMVRFGELNDIVGMSEISAFEIVSLEQKLEAITKDFPNLKSLFQLTDTCECQHCRSVYSPAAYLVDILQFLEGRMGEGKSAKEVLFSRRPDIGEIELSCENANTPVKYIDLVCEVLEETIAADSHFVYTGNLTNGADPGNGLISENLLAAIESAPIQFTNRVSGDSLSSQSNFYISDKARIIDTGIIENGRPVYYLKDQNLMFKIVHEGQDSAGDKVYKVYLLRQTMATAEELDAAPEYVNYGAYTLLEQEKFAFNLPFDLGHSEAKAYLDRFGVKRVDLMKIFQKGGNPAEISIAAERLGINDSQKDIITQASSNTNIAHQIYWNVPNTSVTGYLKRVDRFLNKTELSYQELELLLELEFINPDQKLSINHLDSSCDTEKKEIANLHLTDLDRIHRFLRFQKVTGWSFEIVNEIICQTQFGNGTLDEKCLIKAAQLKEISERSGIKIEALMGCFGEIPHTEYLHSGSKPLYHQIFLNKAKNGVIDKKFLVKNLDGSRLLTDNINYIANCLQLKENELQPLLGLLSSNQMTLSNLSFAFFISQLIKKLKIKPEEFVSLLKISELNFTNGFSLDGTLAVIKHVEQFKTSPLTPSEAQFILKHEADNSQTKEINESKIDELLAELKNEYVLIEDELKSLYDYDLSAEEQLGLLMGALSSLPEISPDFITTIVSVLQKDWRELTNATKAKDFIESSLPQNIEKAAIKSSIESLYEDNGVFEDKQKQLIKEFLDSIANYRISSTKKEFLENSISRAFNIAPELLHAVLKYATLKQEAPNTDLILDLLLISFTAPMAESNYLHQYSSIRLLHKILILLQGLQLNEIEIAWFFKHNSDLNWLEFDEIPHVAGKAPVSVEKYLDFCQTIALSKQLTTVKNPVDPNSPISFFSLVEDIGIGLLEEDFFFKLSLLTGYDKNTLQEVNNYVFGAFEITNYHDINNWIRLLDAADFSRKFGASIDQIQNYIRPVLSLSTVADLRTALKAKYDESTWLETLKEIMDDIRPKKRDALVAYLLATYPDLKDKNDLYEYFLIDVEMEACMPSSRIVQAHNSIQLFVQRCLMGLEPDVIASIEKDPKWNEWTWMKNYRVWEANRKIFLYPENWYDVSLTQDKSFLLEEFINELQQNELTNETAEEALKSYLEKLDDIAFLEVMATWYDISSKTMHVFARTKGGDPATYYYRRFEKERYWTPWEKVELDITGDHLLAFMRNNRLYLAWLIFSEIPNPNQEVPLPNQTDPGPHPVEQPEKKLKIQLAISEYVNKKWKPKKISQDAIETPSNYKKEEGNWNIFDKSNYQIMYLDLAESLNYFTHKLFELFLDEDGAQYSQLFNDVANSLMEEGIYLFHTTKNEIKHFFSITGCKGYPELENNFSQLYNETFYPTFAETYRKSQKDIESLYRPSKLNSLDINRLTPMLNFVSLLKETPGIFKITYPRQFTPIDVLNIFLSTNKKRAGSSLGTYLPYFLEDSNHAYVITPGYYYLFDRKQNLLSNHTERSISNIYTLIEDIVSWLIEAINYSKENPEENSFQDFLEQSISTTKFQEILTELVFYGILPIQAATDIEVSALPPELEELVSSLKTIDPLKYGEKFANMYHPLVCHLRTILYSDGIPALMKRETQLYQSDFNFKSHYLPNGSIVPFLVNKDENGYEQINYPIEDIDFESVGSYSAYNWDLFYRVPLHIATSLTQNQRFEEAMTWFHYMFNPTGGLEGNGSQKYWVTKPFYLHQDADYIEQRIDEILNNTASDLTKVNKDLQFAISEWREKPFSPDVIAKTRPVAYQKAILMKYLDNLIEWGDFLFRQDTMESIAQATQLYILADKLLGPKPRTVPPSAEHSYQTYNQLQENIDSFGNALIELENFVPEIDVVSESDENLGLQIGNLSTLYFCVPKNEQMLAYWDRIADRLFKIRHCQNIDGVERSLALFAPPIDPEMLAKATASGLDLSSIIAGINAPVPHYRFNILAQKATELVQEVRTLGNSLLQVLEKKDAEELSLLRNELELKILKATTDIKQFQIDEATEQIEVLKRTKKVTEERETYYKDKEFMNGLEITALALNGISIAGFITGSIMELVSGAANLVPDVTTGAAGVGGSPVATIDVGGGEKVARSTSSFAKSILLGAQVLDKTAGGISTLASYQRREEEWELQERLATKELDSIEKQIVAAEIRKEIAETDLKNHEIQIENAKKTDEFMRSKFTNKELYDWMVGQISSVYFKSYQLAHDFTKKAEKCYQFELGNSDTFIAFGYWDSMKKGLQSADALIHDIKRMESSYFDKNMREYEITKHVSLAQLDPLALVRLRTAGVCDFEIPEALYDMDHPGQYFRRIKSVSISIPCIAGPYTSVSARLSLVKNRYRKNSNDLDNYLEDAIPGDNRFVYNVGAIQSIATSNAQNDSGIFELNFRDERYLPFENTGAISSWRLELPEEIRQFDYKTIADIILHVKYTAREGGSGLKSAANNALKEQLNNIKQSLNRQGLFNLLNIKHELTNEWQHLKTVGRINLKLSKSRLPYMVQSIENIELESVILLAKMQNNTPNPSIKINSNDIDLSLNTNLNLFEGEYQDIELETPFEITIPENVRANLEELLLIADYKI